MDVGAALLALNINASWLKIDSLSRETNGARVLSALDNSETFAIESLTLIVLETLHAGLATIVNAGDGGSAFHFEEDLSVGMRTEIAVLVNHFHGDEGKAGAVGSNACLVGGEA